MKHVLLLLCVAGLTGWATLPAVFAEEDAADAAITTLTGDLTKVEETQITIKRQGDSGAKTDVVALGDLTKYFVETGKMETVPGEGGATVERPELTEVGSQDLEAGQRVTVKIKAKVATEVVIHKAKPAAAAGGEEKK